MDFSSIIRYSTLPILSGSIFYWSLISTKIRKKIFLIIISILITAICAIQLNKFFYLYNIALYFLVYYSWSSPIGRNGFRPFLFLIRHPFLVLISSCAISTTLFALYWFQYKDRAGLDDDLLNSLVFTQIYRVFFAASDGLLVWIDQFIVSGTPVGFSAMGKICAIVGVSCLDIPSLTAMNYLGSELTSIQTGFLGTGIAVMGLLGVFFSTIIVFLLIIFNNFVLCKYCRSSLFYVASPFMFLGGYFITTSPLTTAMLSGGALLAPLLLLLISLKWTWGHQSSRRKYLQTSQKPSEI